MHEFPSATNATGLKVLDVFLQKLCNVGHKIEKTKRFDTISADLISAEFVQSLFVWVQITLLAPFQHSAIRLKVKS